jgi:hypothetical protein
MVGKEGVAHRINAPAVALHAGMTVEAFSQCDLAYAPPFGPVWDPMLTAANQLIEEIIENTAPWPVLRPGASWVYFPGGVGLSTPFLSRLLG